MQLKGTKGDDIKMKCINWSGFSSGQTMLDGLTGATVLSQDYGQVAYRIQVKAIPM